MPSVTCPRTKRPGGIRAVFSHVFRSRSWEGTARESFAFVVLAALFAFLCQPVVNEANAQDNQTFNKNGAFSEKITIKPKDTLEYTITCKPGTAATFNIKPEFDAKLDIQVMENGNKAASDSGLKNDFSLKWTPKANSCTVKVVSTDTLTNNCTVSFSQGKDATPPAQPGKAIVVKNSGYSTTLNIKPKDEYTFDVQCQAGKQANFNIKPEFDAKLDVQVTHNGKVVASENGLKNKFDISWTPSAAGSYMVKMVSTDTLTNKCTVTFNQGGAAVAGGQVAPGKTIAVNTLPYNATANIQPKEVYTFSVMYKSSGKQASVNVKPDVDAQLDIKVIHNGKVVASDTGLKKSFALSWQPSETGNYTVQIVGTDNIANKCAISFNQGGAAVAGGKVITKNGPFIMPQTFNPNDVYTFDIFSLAGADAAFIIEPKVDAKLDITVVNKKTGVQVASDSGLRTNFKVTWKPAASEAYLITVKSTDNLANECLVAYGEFGKGKDNNVPDAKDPPTSQQKGEFTANIKIHPNQTFKYSITGIKAGKQANFNVKPAIDAKLDISVYYEKAVVASDSGLKNNFIVNWNPKGDGPYLVVVKSTDTLTNDCSVSFSQGGAQSGDTISKDGPFNMVQVIKPKDTYTFKIKTELGKAATFSVKPAIDAKLDIKVLEDGKEVASENALKTNFSLNWTPKAKMCTVKVASTDTLTNNCTISFSQGGAAVGTGGVIKKDGPFNMDHTFKPNDVLSFEVKCKPGKAATFNIKPQFDAKLEVDVFENGNKVSSASGLKNDFALSWTPKANSFTVKVNHTDTLTNKCNITFVQGEKKLALNVNGNLPQGGRLKYAIKMQAGVTYTIEMNSAVFDTYLELEDAAGMRLAQDDDGGPGLNSKMVYTPQASGTYQIIARSFGNNGQGQFTLTAKSQGGN